MFGAPSNVPLVGCRALIALVSYVQWLRGAVGGLSIPCWARGVKISFPLSKASLPLKFQKQVLILLIAEIRRQRTMVRNHPHESVALIVADVGMGSL